MAELSDDSNIVLSFQKQIIQSISPKNSSVENAEYSFRSLYIVARGLGLLEPILRYFLEACMTPKSLVFYLTSNEYFVKSLEEKYKLCVDIFGEDYLNSHRMINMISSTNIGSSCLDRMTVYRQGGLVIVSARMLLMDLLQSKLPDWMITGIIVGEAETVSEYSNEAFVLYLIKQKYPTAFIRALSEQPESFLYTIQDDEPESVQFALSSTNTYNSLAKKMKWLQVDHVNLWPRFHILVKKDLQAAVGRIQLTEWQVEMTAGIRRCQTSLSSLLENLLTELFRLHPSLVGEAELSLEACISCSYFSRLVTNILGGTKINSRTKTLLYDMKNLREITEQLLTLDSVRFLWWLDDWLFGMKLQYPLNPPTWLHSPAMDVLIKWTRDRVIAQNGSKSKEELNTVAYEIPPKWNIFLSILKDIFQSSKSQIIEYQSVPENINSATVLVFVKKRRTAIQLGDLLVLGPIASLEKTYNQYQSHLVKRQKERKLLDTYCGISVTSVNFPFSNISSSNAPYRYKRPTVSSLLASRKKSRFSGIPVPQLVNDGPNIPYETEDIDNFPDSPTDSPEEENLICTYMAGHFGLAQAPVIKFVSLAELTESVTVTLEKTKPSHVILYDGADLSSIRALEVYAAASKYMVSTSDSPLEHSHSLDSAISIISSETILDASSSTKSNSDPFLIVHLLRYKDSFEEQTYLREIRKEKDAFEKLIETKASLPKVISFQEESLKSRLDLTESNLDRFLPNEDFPLLEEEQLLTLEGQCKVNPIIIDMREFKSSLPFYLYKQKPLAIIPRTLITGDFLLSPSIAIERKSLPDLVGSLQQGRLYAQLRVMFASYSNSFLLIELPAVSSLESDTLNKLLLLLLHFKRLKILWSFSNRDSFTYFSDLQTHLDTRPIDPNSLLAQDPDLSSNINSIILESAASLTTNPQSSVSTTSRGSSEDFLYSENDFSLLDALPFVRPSFHTQILRAFGNFREVVNASEVQLTEILGTENGAKLYAWFHNVYHT